MKYTGRAVLTVIALFFSVIQYAVFQESLKKEAMDFAAAAFIAFLAGWHYDRIKFVSTQQKEGAETYKQLVDLLPEAVFIHANNQILYVNQAGLAVIGAETKKQLIGQPVSRFIEGSYQQLSKDHISQVMKARLPVKNDQKDLLRFDGKIISCTISSLFVWFEGKKSILSIVKDETAHKNQTAQLLEKSKQLALVGQLAAGMAHEIRNPLTSIKGFVQLSRSSKEHKDEYFDIMLSELDRINLIVSELLSASKPLASVYKAQSITTILKEVVSLLNAQASMYKVVIETDLDQDLPYVKCEKNQLKQVFINLLKNAIEAMPEGGTVRVEAKQKQSRVAICVIDKGKGMAEEALEKIGEPFYTTKETGTGLGLMTSIKMVESHQGELNVFTKAGEGTTMEVVLPAALLKT